MKNWKIWQIALFTAVCVMLNMGGRLLTTQLEWPLWLDSFGTALSAYVGGPVCGALVGMTGNIAYSQINPLSPVYMLTSIALGVIVSVAARRGWFNRFYGFMMAASLTIFAALIVSLPINIVLAEGYTGNLWGNGVIDFLTEKNVPRFICCVLGQLAIEFPDKVLTIFAVYLVILLRRWQHGRYDSLTVRRGGAAAAAIVCLLVGLCAPARAESASEAGMTDFNDYVQSVYNNNNGLPCGEANDIAQTNDGVLWIGTYAGLYRYNGREFRCIDDYESVRNVNCLYVDEEGRLWIGTNDNGLAIVIREQVVNVLDQSDEIGRAHV